MHIKPLKTYLTDVGNKSCTKTSHSVRAEIRKKRATTAKDVTAKEFPDEKKETGKPKLKTDIKNKQEVMIFMKWGYLVEQPRQECKRVLLSEVLLQVIFFCPKPPAATHIVNEQVFQRHQMATG